MKHLNRYQVSGRNIKGDAEACWLLSRGCQNSGCSCVPMYVNLKAPVLTNVFDFILLHEISLGSPIIVLCDCTYSP